jgi:predicted PurR-regulated permease PerM
MDSESQNSNPVALDRGSLQGSVLAAVTIVCLVVCCWLVAPFFPAIVWSLALAVAAFPIHRWISRRVTHETLAAVASVVIVVLLILVPLFLIAQQVLVEASQEAERFQAWLASNDLESLLSKSPYTANIYQWLMQHTDFGKDANPIQSNIGRNFTQWLSNTIWSLAQFLIMVFMLFFLYRDRASIIQTFRNYVPLSKQESAMVMDRVGNMIYATIYGSLGVAAVQGFLGGLMFWILGLPAPLLWGSAMMLFAVVPVAGAFVIWMPAAVALFIQGSTTKAIILLVYGATAISLIDNLLYPYLVGSRVRLHTVPVFFSIAGGLAVFGVSGLVVGPAVLSLTLALVEVLRKRTEDGRSATEPVKSGV